MSGGGCSPPSPPLAAGQAPSLLLPLPPLLWRPLLRLLLLPQRAWSYRRRCCSSTSTSKAMLMACSNNSGRAGCFKMGALSLPPSRLGALCVGLSVNNRMQLPLFAPTTS